MASKSIVRKLLHYIPFFEGMLITFIVMMVFYGFNYVTCKSRWEQSKYKFLGGCLVKTEEGYFPEKSIRKIYWVYED